MRRIRDLLLLVPLAACYAFIARQNPELAPQLPLFLGFFALFVALPALGLGSLLVRLPLSLVDRLALGAPAALATLFGLVYAGAALRLPWLVWGQPTLGLAACAAALLAARREKSVQPGAESCPSTPWIDLLLMTSVLAAALALFLPKVLATSLPNAGLAMDYYMDDVAAAGYVFSVLRALEHGLPMIQPFVAGSQLVYHVLLHSCYAACALVTGIHPLDQVIMLWPPALWLLLSGAVVAGCRRLAGFSLLETCIASLLLLFTAGYGFYASPTVQLFTYQHTFFLGLPALTLFACALYGYLTGRTTRLFALHAGLCFLVCAATKATLLLLLPVSLLPVLAWRVLRRQARVQELVLAGLCLASAAALKLTIYPDTARVSLRLPSAGKLLLGALGNLGEMGLVLGVYVLLALFAAESNLVLRHKLSRDKQYHLFCLAFVLVSAVLLKMFNFIGGDFYFYWQARVLVLLAFAPIAAHLLRWRTPRFAPATTIVLLAGVGLMLQNHLWPNLFVEKASWTPRDTMAKVNDQGEREGLRWAAANLDRRKVFFTNKATYQGSYIGGDISIDNYDSLGLSGLQGHAWVSPGLPEQALRTARARVARQQAFLDAPTPEARALAMARLDDVDYYFHCIRLAPPGFALPDCLREVHRTASLILYENTCRRQPAAATEPGS